ncbi:MAG: phosphotransferase [Acidobacteria bacterium]|nr:phosphotransferase [Acidobacteriota bacterium]
MSEEQQNRLEEFLREAGLGEIEAELTPDASTRQFFRVKNGDSTVIACVYGDGDTDGPDQLIDVTGLFIQAGLPVAKVVKSNAEHSVVILEDLGDRILRDSLLTATEGERDRLIEAAIELIPRIQSATDLAISSGSIAGKLRFDEAKLSWELDFFREHYFHSLRGREIPSAIESSVSNEFKELSAWLEQRAAVLCHRDFHAANLMIRPDGSLAIIDHQDARIGSVTYDLVSLLLDRVTEPPSDDWIAGKIHHFLKSRTPLGLPTINDGEFASEFDHQTVQRCLKAVGTFSFQSAFRGKKHFEAYIRPMFRIVIRSLERLGKYPNLRELLSAEVG